MTAKRRLSGYCNPSLPRTTLYDPHQRCTGCDCTATGCPCAPPQETSMPKPTPEVHPDVTDDLDGPLVEAVAALRVAAEAISKAGMTAEQDYTWLQAIALLDHLRGSLQTIGITEATLERHIYLTGEHGDHEVDGIGVVSIRRTRANERWDGRGAVYAAVDQHMADRAGEQPDPHDVVEWVLEVAGIGYCRKTELRKLGLEVDAFYESTPGRIKIDTPKHD